MEYLKRLKYIKLIFSILIIQFTLVDNSFAQLDQWKTVGGPAISNTDTIFSLAINPTNPDTIFAGGKSSTVYRSLNGGATWTQISAFEVLSSDCNPEGFSAESTKINYETRFASNHDFMLY